MVQASQDGVDALFALGGGFGALHGQELASAFHFDDYAIRRDSGRKVAGQAVNGECSYFAKTSSRIVICTRRFFNRYLLFRSPQIYERH